jgi:hypothetical protein
MISVEFQDGNKYEEEHNSEVIHQKGVSVNDKEKVKTDLAEWTEKGNSISCACDKEKTKELQFSIEAIKQGEVKVENQGNPIEIDVRPSPVNMVKIDCEKETSKVTLIGFEQTVKNMGSLITKIQKLRKGQFFRLFIAQCPILRSISCSGWNSHGSQVAKNTRLLPRSISRLESIFHGRRVIKSRKSLHISIGCLKISFHGIQVGASTMDIS